MNRKHDERPKDQRTHCDTEIPCPHQHTHRAFTRRQFILTSAGAAAGVVMGCGKRKDANKPQEGEKARQPDPGKGAGPAGRKLDPRPTGTEGRPAPAVAGRGTVFKVTHKHALDKDNMPAIQPVEAMLDHLMLELTGQRTPKDAWAALFKPSDIVGLKPNTLGTDWCSPHPALVLVIIKKLQEVGVSPKNIVIWDRYHFAETKLYTALKKSPVITKLQDEWGFDPKVFSIPSGKKVRFNNALHKATAVVNIPVFKDHGRSGVTGALKNMSLGCIDNPREHHPTGCNPYVPEIYNLSPIRDKVRLIIADVFRIIYKGGPSGPRSRKHNIPDGSLYATRDPVALDRIIWDVLDRIRKDKGIPLLIKGDKGPDGKPLHVLHAGKLGLGESSLANIKLKTKVMG